MKYSEIIAIVSDGDFAAKVGRPDIKVGKLIEMYKYECAVDELRDSGVNHGISHAIHE